LSAAAHFLQLGAHFEQPFGVAVLRTCLAAQPVVAVAGESQSP
jgi:hypothetical protein